MLLTPVPNFALEATRPLNFFRREAVCSKIRMDNSLAILLGEHVAHESMPVWVDAADSDRGQRSFTF